MTKHIVFDFVCDTAVAVVAECGTNPEDLKTEAIQKLIQQLVLGQAEVHCDNVYDPDTGLYGHPENVYEDLKLGDYDAGL
jgi:hypothetical protein